MSKSFRRCKCNGRLALGWLSPFASRLQGPNYSINLASYDELSNGKLQENGGGGASAHFPDGLNLRAPHLPHSGWLRGGQGVLDGGSFRWRVCMWVGWNDRQRPSPSPLLSAVKMPWREEIMLAPGRSQRRVRAPGLQGGRPFMPGGERKIMVTPSGSGRFSASLMLLPWVQPHGTVRLRKGFLPIFIGNWYP